MHRLLAAFLIGWAITSTIAADPAPKDTPKTLILTAKDHGKTIEVRPERLIEVRLTNEKPNAGWEPGATEIRGENFVRENAKRIGNCDAFLPRDEADPKSTVGVYVYRYVATQPGTGVLRLTHLFPGGPNPMRRSATELIAEFKVTIVTVK